MQQLEEANIEEVQAVHKSWYRPKNASLAISGNFDPDNILRLIEKYFGDIPKADLPSRPRQDSESITSKKNITIEDAVSLPSVAIAFRSAEIYSNDDYALDIIADILSRGRSSRLY